jgi:hypothetical protein
MLKSLAIRNVGLASDLELHWARRFNIIGGNNGAGKSFLLDLCWWALTRTWADEQALPNPGPSKACIDAEVVGKTNTKEIRSVYSREKQSWPLDNSRPAMPGLVVYIRVDGSFSVWDPARNYWRKDPSRPSAYHFNKSDVWNGLDVGGIRVCEGLERDWVNWQEANKSQFDSLKSVLRELSAPNEPLKPGSPRRLYLGEGKDRPTIDIDGSEIPVSLASAGARRILAIAYILVWTWYEHHIASRLLGKDPDNRFVVLFDEPETHLHPRWQRTIIPALLSALGELRWEGIKVDKDYTPQFFVSTHSPLVLASLEPIFSPALDQLLHLEVQNGQIRVTDSLYAKQGDVANWLVSEFFGLDQARSKEAEDAIEEAEGLMRTSPQEKEGLEDKQRIHGRLLELLPEHDPFWPRWVMWAQPQLISDREVR